jgi:transcriptional regulator with XRE-family HTH domain
MPLDARIRFGRAIRRIREEQRINQEEAAERCGLHRTYYSGVEHGVRNFRDSAFMTRMAEDHTWSAERHISAFFPAKAIFIRSTPDLLPEITWNCDS